MYEPSWVWVSRNKDSWNRALELRVDTDVTILLDGTSRLIKLYECGDGLSGSPTLLG